MDAEELFVQAMEKVKPIAETQKKQPKPVTMKTRVLRVKRVHPTLDLPSSNSVSPQATEDAWVLRADGVSRERLKRLAVAAPAVTLDLHGLTRDEALDLLQHEFELAFVHKQRVIAVVHGRGLHSQGKAVLKDAVYQWLQDGALARHILAVIPQPGSGGGACLVLLRRQA